MKPQVLKYKDLRQQSQTQKELMELEYEENSAKLQLESDILATNLSLGKVQKELRIAKSEFPLNTQEIINKQIEVESLLDGLKRLEKLKNELF